MKLAEKLWLIHVDQYVFLTTLVLILAIVWYILSSVDYCVKITNRIWSKLFYKLPDPVDIEQDKNCIDIEQNCQELPRDNPTTNQETTLSLPPSFKLPENKC